MTEQEYDMAEDQEVVYRAPDEFTANIVKGLLVGEDIPVILKSRMAAMYDGALTMGEGYWGDVIVPTRLADRSRAIIEAFHEENESKG
jgi:hypothetical protein